MSPEDFRRNGKSFSVRQIDTLLEKRIKDAVFLEGDTKRAAAQGHLQTYLVDHPLALEAAAKCFDRFLEQKKNVAGIGFQETFPILFRKESKASLNEKLMVNMVSLLASAKTEELREKTTANIDAALALRPDLKKAVEDAKKRLMTHTPAARSAERRASIYAVISSL